MDHHTPGCFNGFISLFSRKHKLEPVLATGEENGFAKVIANQDRLKSNDVSVCALQFLNYEYEIIILIADWYSKSICPFCCSYVSGTDTKETPSWALDMPEETGPPPYAVAFGESIYRPEVMNTIEKEITSLDDELRDLNLKIHDHPEIGFQEFYAHDTLTEFMRSHEFKVTPHLAGIKTAWRAEWSYGKGGRTLGINAEMDALPGIGHACGHNLIAVSGVAVAIAAKAAMKAHQIPGKVVLLGTPAEEGGGGKVLLLERGAYKDMDACVMSHPGPGLKNSVFSGPYLAIQPLTVEYFGHTAHAAYAPWEGQNALDAAVLAYNAISMLRQQIKPDCRVHGIIQGRDWAANIIPDYAKMQWIVRAPSYTELTELLKRVRACIEAAGVASGCRIGISEGIPYYELRQNPVLGILRNGQGEIRYAVHSAGGQCINGFSLPAIHPLYGTSQSLLFISVPELTKPDVIHPAIPTQPNGGNHTPEFTQSSRTPEAYAAAMRVAKGLALVGIRVLDDSTFFKQVSTFF
ncbi:hypothetical protein A7U60_g866 [Sanghuangporus baumii]|uniref:Peptidase M20 dimerisation domain-containing protein n=1 Tax=Sanghuangporus baumii TaxID=108892 RepID=A0A9Q5NBN4_SANBA|nr:hypothetical protein A7U60_g866 [Sanghuangporus baumii]